MVRYVPDRAFPAYSYVPGKFPHPHRDPQGHSHGVDVVEQSPPTFEDWQECESYLWGIDLFNAGFYWEAHEAWEAAWISVGRQGPIADFLKALIKLAAAGVKAREGRAAGVARHAARCLELLAVPEIDRRERVLGLIVSNLVELAMRVNETAESLTKNASHRPLFECQLDLDRTN